MKEELNWSKQVDEGLIGRPVEGFPEIPTAFENRMQEIKKELTYDFESWVEANMRDENQTDSLLVQLKTSAVMLKTSKGFVGFWYIDTGYLFEKPIEDIDEAENAVYHYTK